MSQLVDDSWTDSVHNWAIREGQSMDWTRIKRNAELKAIEQRRQEDAREAKYRQFMHTAVENLRPFCNVEDCCNLVDTLGQVCLRCATKVMNGE